MGHPGKCYSPFFEAPPAEVRSVSPVSQSERPGAPSVWFLGRRDRGARLAACSSYPADANIRGSRPSAPGRGTRRLGDLALVEGAKRE
jgi:hypothetical protein